VKDLQWACTTAAERFNSRIICGNKRKRHTGGVGHIGCGFYL